MKLTKRRLKAIIAEEITAILEQKVDLTTKILGVEFQETLCSQVQRIKDRYGLPIEDLRAGMRGGAAVIVHKTYSEYITEVQKLEQYCSNPNNR